MTTRTKIICTIGPSVNTYDKITALIKAGMNVARINFSHGTYEEHKKSFSFLKQARQELGTPLAIMADTRGPELRLGKIANDEMTLSEGDRWLLVKEEVVGDRKKVTISPPSILEELPKNTPILFDDVFISSRVIET